MGYETSSEEIFSRRFSQALRGERTGARNLGRRKRRIVHGASLDLILIFCKKLLALIALAVGGRAISSNLRFSVMAGLDPVIQENVESIDQIIDNVA